MMSFLTLKIPDIQCKKCPRGPRFRLIRRTDDHLKNERPLGQRTYPGFHETLPWYEE